MTDQAVALADERDAAPGVLGRIALPFEPALERRGGGDRDLRVGVGLGAAGQLEPDLGPGHGRLPPEIVGRTGRALVIGRDHRDDDGQSPEKALFHGAITP